MRRAVSRLVLPPENPLRLLASRTPVLLQRRCFGQEFPRGKRTVLRGNTKSEDPWSILGVARSAEEADVKKAYIAMAKQCHPDRTGGDDTKFKKVKEAYDLIKSGRANELFPSAASSPQGDGWARGFGGFQKPPDAQGWTYSSSQTTYDSRGGYSNTYTYRDATGQQFTRTEHNKGDMHGPSFWDTFAQAQAEALRMESERMKERAAQSEFQRVLENWAHHQNMQSVQYAEYVQARDRAVYKGLLAFLVIFLSLRILLNFLV
eukprot:Hpha_TRINITY_DN23848_c0_g1::TRINITY_DN23848_c0_g1_i1::g.109853::m.109853